jgi:hypothetical protein
MVTTPSCTQQRRTTYEDPWLLLPLLMPADFAKLLRTLMLPLLCRPLQTLAHDSVNLVDGPIATLSAQKGPSCHMRVRV